MKLKQWGQPRKEQRKSNFEQIINQVKCACVELSTTCAILKTSFALVLEVKMSSADAEAVDGEKMSKK